jgi:uncharacterized RDD family membrane protein YckC
MASCFIPVLVVSTVSAENPPPIYKLVVAGNDQILWFAVGELNQQQKFIQRFYYIDNVSKKIRPIVGIMPQVGDLARWTVVDHNLHVFYDDGTHYLYRKYSIDRQIRLPNSVIPLAIAGELNVKHHRLWALVDAETADLVDVQWQRTLAKRTAKRTDDKSSTTQKPGPTPTEPSIVRAKGTHHLVQYSNIDWRPGFPAPDNLLECKRAWLCATGNIHHLWWQQDQNDNDIHYARHEQNRWIDGPSIPLSRKCNTATCGINNNKLFFAALTEDPIRSSGLQCNIWILNGDPDKPTSQKWEMQPPLIDQDGKKLSLPGGTSLGTNSKQLALLWMNQDRAQVGLWPVNGQLPDRPLINVPLEKTYRKFQNNRKTKDIITIITLAAVLMLLFWRRNQSLAKPLLIPEDLKIVGPAKRALAALIDMIPAAAVILTLYHTPLTEFMEELQTVSENREQVEAMEFPSQLKWAWAWFMLSYTAYCTLFELLISVTPGKRLLGFMVISETIEPTSLTQILIRNLFRLVELFPYLSIWPFMLVVFFTQNHQRVGDLIARTIAVQKQ